ncbi:MAG TPA: hypothetical protein VNJ04_04015 [Gemmatimonadaceae bacterium]|nr:hypothetical protein [Gemmatimonadaceae bacterium]
MTPTSEELVASLADPRIAGRRAELAARRVAINDESQLLVSSTRVEVEAARYERVMLDRQIAAIDSAVSAVASVGSADADEQWHNTLTTARAQLVDERMKIKSPIRDAWMLGLARNLALSIGAVDRGRRVFTDSGWDLENSRLGELLRAAGYEQVGADPDRNYGGALPWHGRLTEVESRIAKLVARRAAVKAQLDEALMSDAERARRDAESAARVSALNALPTRKSRGDGSQYDQYPDGRREEVDE